MTGNPNLLSEMFITVYICFLHWLLSGRGGGGGGGTAYSSNHKPHLLLPRLRSLAVFMAPPTPPHPPFPSPSGNIGDRKRKRIADDGASPSDPPAALLPPQNMSTQVTDAAVSAIADKVGDLVGTLWDESLGLVANIIFLSRKADEVAEEMGKLRSLQDDLKHKAEDEARQNQAKVSNQLEQWVSRVRSLGEDAAKFQRSFEDRSTFLTRFRLGYDAVELLKQARKLAKEGNDFSGGGAPLTCPRGPDPVEQVPSETLSSTLVGGREALQKVEGYIMDDGVGIIGIYGMGGVGKTTLLKIINNEFLRGETCRDKFDVAIWVTVSQDVQISSIRETVAGRLGLPSSTSKDELFRHLSKKRFILLLDDVWRKLDLVETGIPLPQTMNHSGKILFTTRYEQVCGEMDADQMVKINSLDDESSWELLRSKLGTGVTVLDNNPSIRQLAEEVVRRCGGLPIALITVGRAMSSAKTAYEWKDAIRKLDQCPAELSPGMEDDVLKSLKFSFEKLKDEAHRKCLLYCALFPEDFEIPKDEIIDYWIGEGFLDPEDFDEDNIEETRCRGYVLVRDLQNACLLEETFIGTYNGRECVKLHDTVRDMALWIAGHDFVVLAHSHSNASPSQLVPKPSIWENTRRISMINYCNIEKPPSSSFPNLTTLLLRYSSSRYFRSFTSIPALRVLDLSGTSLQWFPYEITSLTSLQYLSLSRNLFPALPVELGNLINLRILILGPSMNLKSIPAEAISRLSHLQVLNINCDQCQFGDFNTHPYKTQFVPDMKCAPYQLSLINCPPQLELSDLANLKRLSELHLPVLCSWASLGLIVASPVLRRSTRNLDILVSSVSRPPPLKRRSSQQPPPPTTGDLISEQNGRLSEFRILELEDHPSDPPPPPPPPPPPTGDTISKQIGRLSNLRRLVLCANPSDPVMGELQLYPISRVHQNLEFFHITHFREAKFSINNISCHGSEPLFPRLRVLYIKNCDGCSELTWVGRLPCLETLKVTDCEGLREVMVPLDGGGSHDHHAIMPSSFPKLKHMNLSRLPLLRSISTSTLLFPCLERLEVSECPRLQRPFRPQSAKNLCELKIYSCDGCLELTWVGLLPCLEELSVSDCQGLREVMMPLDGGGDHDHHPIMPSSFQKLKGMDLKDLPSLRNISTATLLLPCLEWLQVQGCPRLQRLPFGPQSAKNLQHIYGPKAWWDRLEWDDGAHQQNFRSKFVALHLQ